MYLKGKIKNIRPKSSKIDRVGGHPKLADGFAYPPRAMRSERAAAYLSIGENPIF